MSIPRHVWDPAQHNTKWHDSYAKRITERRNWPIKKYSVGLEPETPEDWLQYSVRNLAYAYNGALRSCSSFPEMIPYYQEMKQRGVKIDVDTLFVMLSRAARYDRISIPDIFKLYDEMISFGARPDLPVAEVLHTLYDHSVSCEPEWRETKRQQLVDLYNHLCVEHIVQCRMRGHVHLMQSHFHRYRQNLRQLNGRMTMEAWRAYLHTLTSADTLFAEATQYLWDLVPETHKSVGIPLANVEVPELHGVLKRSDADSDADLPDGAFEEDERINEIFCAAVERSIDYPLQMKATFTNRAVLLALTSIFWKSGALMGGNLAAQIMDVVKYSGAEQRDSDAILFLNYAGRVSTSLDDRVRKAWLRRRPVVDGRVVGRYLAARDPWSATKYSLGSSRRVADKFSAATVAKAAEAVQSSVATDAGGVAPAANAIVPSAQPPTQQPAAVLIRTPEDVDIRWRDVQKLIEQTKVLSSERVANLTEDGDSVAAEVFTGQAVFLRRMIQGITDLGVLARIFDKIAELKQGIDQFYADTELEPELEAWESLCVAIREIMDCVAHPKTSSTSERAQADEFFKRLASYRGQLLTETAERFNGRFAVIWLQES